MIKDILYETIHPKSGLKNCIFVLLAVLHFVWLHFALLLDQASVVLDFLFLGHGREPKEKLS